MPKTWSLFSCNPYKVSEISWSVCPDEYHQVWCRQFSPQRSQTTPSKSTNASRENLASFSVNARSRTFIPCGLANAINRRRVTPFQIDFSSCHKLILGINNPSIGRPPSVPEPSLSICYVSCETCSLATCLARTFGNKAIDLILQRAQQMSRWDTTEIPSLIMSAGIGGVRRAVTTSAGLICFLGNRCSRLATP